VASGPFQHGGIAGVSASEQAAYPLERTRNVAVFGASGAVSTHETRAQPGLVASAAKRIVVGLPTADCEKRMVTVRSLVRPTIAVATFCGASLGIVFMTDPCVVSASARAVMQAT